MLFRSTLLLAALGFQVGGVWGGTPSTGQQPLQPDHKTKPNIVFILTDDQDVRMDSLAYMPNVQRHLAAQGTTFQRHYCTVALCCPSRVNLWTGKAAHNTNVTNVNPPYGICLSLSMKQFTDQKGSRWLPEIHQPRLQRGLAPRVAATGRLQHLLHRQTVQLAHDRQLRLAFPGRLHGVGLPARPSHVRVLERQLPEEPGASRQSRGRVLDRRAREQGVRLSR